MIFRRAITALLLAVTGVSAWDAATGYAATLPVSSGTLTIVNGSSTLTKSTCTLVATHDNFSDENAPTNTPSATATTLRVRSQSGARNRRGYVRFDLTTCAIPAGAQIQTASLRLVMTSHPGASRTYGVHRVTAAWTETTLKWSPATPFAATATSSVASGTVNNTPLVWDVRTDVVAAPGATNYGWVVKDSVEESSTSREASFATDEHGTTAYRPSLTITYY
jgi:hypothetical protein